MFYIRMECMKKGFVVCILCAIGSILFAQSGGGEATGTIISTIVTLLLLVGYLCLCIIPAKIAKSKGRSFIRWYIFGVLVFIVALICSICIKSKNVLGDTK